MNRLKKVLIIGPGRLGQTLAMELAHRSEWVFLHGLRPPPTMPGVEASHGSLENAPLDECPLIVLTVRDEEIEEVAQQLALFDSLGPDTIILHTSGLKSSKSLVSLRARGFSVGSMHPLQSFSLPPTLGQMAGVFFAVEGDAGAVVIAKALAHKLGGAPKEMEADSKVFYHASAVMASNLFVSLVDAACDLAAGAGLEKNEALQILLPLIKGSVANLDGVGLPEALTGPISRGDSVVVSDHLQALSNSPDLLGLYCTLSRRAVVLALEQKASDPKKLEKVLKVLASAD